VTVLLVGGTVLVGGTAEFGGAVVVLVGGGAVVLGDGGPPAAEEVEGGVGVADAPDKPAMPRWAGAVWKLSSPTSPATVATTTMTGRFMSAHAPERGAAA
jgi:hypothetical protein